MNIVIPASQYRYTILHHYAHILNCVIFDTSKELTAIRGSTGVVRLYAFRLQRQLGPLELPNITTNPSLTVDTNDTTKVQTISNAIARAILTQLAPDVSSNLPSRQPAGGQPDDPPHVP